MWFSSVELLAVVSCLSLTRGVQFEPSIYHVKETVEAPRHWIKHSVASPDDNIVLRIGLFQPNFPELERHLYEVSDPYHERYGKHLSKEEVDDLVAPLQESIDVVDSWLASHGLEASDLTRSPAKDWVTITVPIRLAEKMLDATYNVWKHVETGDTAVRTTSYSLPRHLHDHVDLVQPTTLFGGFKAAKVKLIEAADHMQAEIADQPPILSNATSGNSIGITGYLKQYANFEDLQSFYKEQRPDAVGSFFKLVSIRGGINSQNLSEAGLEADLDVQFAFGLTYPTPATFYTTASRPPQDITLERPDEPYIKWLDFVLAHNDSQFTISTSYAEDEQLMPVSWARRSCAQFAQLGARGVSLLFSSGDYGVADASTGTCLTNDGQNITRFQPGFPASCPYVTVVGGTTSIPEIAVTRYPSGGGFSNLFPRPYYQDKAVKAYLKTLPQGLYKGLYNPYGRAYPDVAAQGDHYRIILGGVPHSIGGTSASSPTFAGIVTLLNDARLTAGLPPLGFLNPLLYSKGIEGLNDITVGSNPGCGTQGFNATKGWDPVTGLGTPNFVKLKEIVLQNKGY